MPEEPEISVRLEFTPALAAAIGANYARTQTIAAAAAAGVNAVARGLGIPGKAVALCATGPDRGARWLRVRMNGKLCRYPLELLWRARSAAQGCIFGSTENTKELAAWLRDPASGTDEIAEFFNRALHAIAARHASALLGPAQLDAYLTPRLREDPRVQDVLAALIDLHLPISNAERIADLLESCEGPFEQVCEDLASELQTGVIEIRVRADDLRQWTLEDSQRARGAFSNLRDNLFYELGMRFPDLRFVLADRKPGTFAFCLNGCETMPWQGLKPGEVLVNELPETIGRLGVRVTPVLHPETRAVLSLVSLKALPDGAAAHLSIYGPVQYMLMCLGAELRENAARLLDLNLMRRYLHEVETPYPALVRAIRRMLPEARLTRALRRLVAEQVSIRDFKRILDWLLDCDWIPAEERTTIIFDDRLANPSPTEEWLNDSRQWAAFARSGLKRYLSYKYARSRTTLPVYVLDPEIEQRLAEMPPGGLADEVVDRILEGVRQRAGDEAPYLPTPVLTYTGIRFAVRELLAEEFPWLPVLAYRELPPGTNIRSEGQIGWPS